MILKMISSASRLRHWIGVGCFFLVTVSGVYGFVTATYKESRYQAQLAGLSERELAIRELIESDGYGLAIVDGTGEIKEWNPALAEWSNWPVEQALGKNIEEVVQGKEVGTFLEVMNAAKQPIEGGKEPVHPKTTVAYCSLKPKGEKPPIPVRVTVRVVDSPKGPYAVAIVDKQQEVKLLDAPAVDSPKSAKVEKQMMEESRGD